MKKGSTVTGTRAVSSVLALLLAVVGLGVMGCSQTDDPQSEDAETFSTTEAALAGGWDALSWTGDGRFAVLQTFDESGTPVVFVWDSESGESFEEEGYRVLAIEPGSSVVWLEPLTAEDVGSEMMEDEYAFLDLGPFDDPPSSLEAWDLASGEGPSDSVPARYQADDGGVEYIAYYEVDPLRGALPSKMLFNNLESSGEGHKAQLPDDLVTFSVVGWSPSGEFVAIEEMTQKSAAIAASDPQGGADVPFPERRLLVVEASSGDVVEETLLGEDVVAPAQWLGDTDVLVWPSDPLEEMTFDLKALEVGGELGTFSEVVGVELPAEMMGGTPPYPLGSGTFGLTAVVWTPEGVAELWRLDSVSAEPIGVFDVADQMAWSQEGGVAVMVYEFEDETGDEHVTVTVSDESGADSVLAIIGPTRPGLGMVGE